MDTAGSCEALVAFSFESRMAPGLPLSAQQRLFERASLFNIRMQLTGELGLSDGWLSATVEGRPEILLPLAGRIIADRRHEAIRVRFFGRCERRAFAGWTTRGVDVGRIAEDFGGPSNVRQLTRREPARFARAGRAGDPAVTGIS